MKKATSDRRADLPRSADYTRQFRKDWARYQKAGKIDMNAVTELMALIIFRKPLGAEWRDHQLAGSEWNGAREAHVGGDLLLVYICDDERVDFVRLGSHSELFGR